MKDAGLGPIMTRDELVRWIDSCVLADLRTLSRGIECYDASPDQKDQSGRALGAGHFLLVAGCCMALDYCGYIYRGVDLP